MAISKKTSKHIINGNTVVNFSVLLVFIYSESLKVFLVFKKNELDVGDPNNIPQINKYASQGVFLLLPFIRALYLCITCST